MADRARRKRFQIHLSTAVVMMFAAGAFILANTHLHKVKGPTVSQKDDLWMGLIYHRYGWPFVFSQSSVKVLTRQDKIVADIHSTESEWQTSRILFNLAILVLTLGIVGFSLEWLIRWRAARKGA